MARSVLIILIFFSDFSISLGQKTLDGNLLFKESFYYYRLSRNTFDTVITYSSYELNSMIEIEQVAVLSANNTEEVNYLPIAFYKNEDSIFYKYADPYDIDHDTTYVKLFPLNLKDSIEVAYCFKITMDTLRGTDPNKTLSIRTDCDGDDLEIKTYRTNDTLIYFKELKLDCYTFEQKSLIGNYKDTYFTRKIIVDKQTLIPIDVKEYNFHNSRRTRFKNLYQGKDLLTYHQKLISVE